MPFSDGQISPLQSGKMGQISPLQSGNFPPPIWQFPAFFVLLPSNLTNVETVITVIENHEQSY
jgi:hypothetical protein